MLLMFQDWQGLVEAYGQVLPEESEVVRLQAQHRPITPLLAWEQQAQVTTINGQHASRLQSQKQLCTALQELLFSTGKLLTSRPSLSTLPHLRLQRFVRSLKLTKARLIQLLRCSCTERGAADEGQWGTWVGSALSDSTAEPCKGPDPCVLPRRGPWPPAAQYDGLQVLLARLPQTQQW